MSIITCRSHFTREPQRFIVGQQEEVLLNYIGGSTGSWHVNSVTTHAGAPLKTATHVEIVKGRACRPPMASSWVLRGVVRNTRFVTREELPSLDPQFLKPGPVHSSCAALIPIRKSAAWWNLEHDERQEIVDARSRQLGRGMRFLPAIARRFLYGRDLGEPFDMVTWFEYSSRDQSIFDDLAGALRSSIEWQYIERDVEIRLVKER
jgi:hypothetical protein